MVTIEQLAQEITAHRRAYYAGNPRISDSEYDKLEADLRRLDPDHPLLQKVGSEVGSATKTAHAVPMLSLQKTYLEKELYTWRKQEQVVGALKIDGNGLSLVYDAGKLVMAKTRGDGLMGENVTAKINHMPVIPSAIGDTTALEIRGELYCSLPNFFRLASNMESCDLPRPTSPRNVIAGLLGRKKHHHLMRHISFMAYDLFYSDDATFFSHEMTKLEKLAILGFDLPAPRLLSSETEIKSYLEYVKNRMEENDIGIDGAVFSFNSLSYARELGNTSHHPRSRLAFKWQGETAVAKIVRINWHTSRFGIVTPVAEIDPVTLSKATIRRVTLHNFSYVKLYNLKRGDEIEIVRSGEVIPKFLAVVTASEGETEMPDKCPRCGGELEDDGVRLFCVDSSCPAQQLLAILNWIKCVDIRDLSEKRLASLMEQGLVKSIPDLYRLTVSDLLRMPLTQKKMAQKLVTAIATTRELTAEQFLSGLGIRGAGKASWRLLLREAKTIAGILRLSVAEISAIQGFAEKSAQSIAHGLQARRQLISELSDDCGIKIRTESTSGDTLAGQKFVISGALSQPRAYYRELIAKNGGTVTASVSSNTRAVISADPTATSSKVKQAHKLGIPLLNEKEFLALLDDN